MSWIGEALKERSADTIDDLIENHTSARLPRMTLWLLDVSTDEMLDLWRALDERGELDMRTYDLILVHWTELDPRGAIAAAKESNLEGPAWWAWGRADPKLAMETVLRESPQYASSVLRSIGQFHIDLALQVMEQHPEALAHGSIEGIGSGLRRDDPERAVEFLRGHGQSASDAIKKWAEENPDSALAWARTNISGRSDGDVETLVAELVVEHPDRVQGWLETLPTGSLRGALAEEYIRHLADQDLDQALALANGEEGVQTRARLLAALGERLAYHRPDESLALLLDTISAQRAGTTAPGTAFDAESGQYLLSWGNQLLATRPEATMDKVAGLTADGGTNLAGSLMNTWMERDELAYARWLLDREPDTIRDLGTSALVSQLMGERGSNYGEPPDYLSALEWASSIEDAKQRSSHLRKVVSAWARADPGSAAEYFEASPDDDPARALFETQRER